MDIGSQTSREALDGGSPPSTPGPISPDNRKAPQDGVKNGSPQQGIGNSFSGEPPIQDPKDETPPRRKRKRPAQDDVAENFEKSSACREPRQIRCVSFCSLILFWVLHHNSLLSHCIVNNLTYSVGTEFDPL